MATYVIKTPYRTRIMKRRDAAVMHFRKEVYAALHAGGQLDTAAGNKVHAACEIFSKDVESGAYSLFSFSHPLPHSAGLISFERNT